MPRVFHVFYELFDELQAEVRVRFTPGSRALLGLTCRGEYALALTQESLGEKHNLLFALVESNTREDRRLLRRTLRSSKFRAQRTKLDDPKLHDLKHVAIRTEQARLVRWLMKDSHGLFEQNTCHECVRLGAHTLNYHLILFLAETHSPRVVIYFEGCGPSDRASTILTVEALRVNNVFLLKWLRQESLFDADFDLEWDRFVYEHRGEPYPVSTALDWYKTYLRIHTRCTEKTQYMVVKSVMECMVSRQWTITAICQWFDATEVPELWTLRLFYLGMRFNNESVIQATWNLLSVAGNAQFSDAINFLVQIDDEEQSWGCRLLKPPMIGRVYITGKNLSYIVSILPKIQ